MAAGLSAGISCLFKITGAYFLAAILLFLLWRSGSRRRPAAGGFGGGRLLVVAAVLVFLVAVALVLRSHLGIAQVYHFVLPQVAVAALVLAGARTEFLEPQWHLQRTLPAFLSGVLLPIIAFAGWYATQAGLKVLWHGAFILPAKRLVLVVRSPVSIVSILPMLIVFTMIVIAYVAQERRRRAVNLVLVVGFSIVLALSSKFCPLSASVGPFLPRWSRWS